MTATLDLAPWTDRILDDGTNRERWLAARADGVIGASDAAKLAKIESVDKYLAQKLAPSSFNGNSYTASGNRWEPMMLAWAGIPGNVALIHSPAERGFAATPDGIDPTGRFRLAECKAKHMKVVAGPTLGEWRQLAWQFVALPEAEVTEFVWVELDQDGELRTALRGEPKHLTVTRDSPQIRSITEQILPIATELLARLRVALAYKKELGI